MAFLSRYRLEAQGLLRIVAGLMFMQHGVQKLFGWLGGHGPVPLASQGGLAGVLETFGGALVALGLFTAPVAFLLSGMMAVAYFQAHAPQAFFPIENNGELAALYCFVFLFLAAAGPGRFSLDRLLGRGRDEEEAAPAAPRRDRVPG